MVITVSPSLRLLRRRLHLKPGRRGAVLLTLAAGGLLLGLTAGPAWAGKGDEQPLGQDLAGRNCLAKPHSSLPAEPGAPVPLELFCDGRSAGTLAAQPLPGGLPADQALRLRRLHDAAQTSLAARADFARISCPDGQWFSLPGDRLLALSACQRRDGGVPSLAVIGEKNGRLWRGSGTPALLPLLDQLISGNGQAAAVSDDTRLKPDEARTLLQRLGLSDAAMGDAPDQIRRLSEQARQDNGRHDYRAAELAWRQALTRQEGLSGADSPATGLILMALALDVSNQGRSGEAAALFRRAGELVQKSPNLADHARLSSYLAFDAANAGRVEDAVRYGADAVGQWRRLADGSALDLGAVLGGDRLRVLHRGELAHALNVYAAAALRLEMLADAENAIREAVRIIGEEKGLPPQWRPEILQTYGEVMLKQNRFTDADRAFRAALVQAQTLFGDTAPTALVLLGVGHAQAAQGNSGDAVKAYRAALTILKQDSNARDALTPDRIAPLLQAVVQRGQGRDPALTGLATEAVQLTGGGLADQVIRQASARLAAGSPDLAGLLGKLQELERGRDAIRLELARQTALPDDQRGSALEAALLGELDKRGKTIAGLQAEIGKRSPAYAAMNGNGAVPLATLQSLLDPGEALIQYVPGRESSYALVITRNVAVVRPVGLTLVDLNNQIQTLRRGVTVLAGERVGRFDLATAHSLYRALMAPLLPDLAGTDRLLVVGSGSLDSLPFAVLLASPPAGKDNYRQADWLIRHYAITQLPSAGALAALRASDTSTASTASATTGGNGSAGKRRLLALANPPFLGSAGRQGLGTLARSCRLGAPVSADLLRGLAPLPETENEVRTVAASLGAGVDSLLLGTAASEPALRQALSAGPVQVLYLATHGLLPGELTCQAEPGLALAPPADGTATSRDRDGLLEASEIAALPLRADLVVLSACNTAGSGDDSGLGGEALTGLADAFFHGGARAVIASHWQVPSKATASLMSGLFAGLTGSGGTTTTGPGSADSAARALQAAQIRLLNDPATAHPFYWAAFTVIGDGALSLNRSSVRPAAATGAAPAASSDNSGSTGNSGKAGRTDSAGAAPGSVTGDMPPLPPPPIAGQPLMNSPLQAKRGQP